MRYGSICSGIEAATVAWHPLGFRPSFFSEIDKFPRAVLSHHYPHVPLHGDFTTIGETDYDAIDLLVGGTPCQSFSIAGLRKGLADERGNLTLEFVRLAERLGPRWLVWENVPGVLSSDKGRAFGSLLGALAELGYGFAYRVLDAQYFGVPQRRRRVFVVGYLGDWRPPAAVLFEREGLLGDITPCRQAREETAGAITSSSFCGGAGGRPEGATAGHFRPVKGLSHWDGDYPHPTLNRGGIGGIAASNQEIFSQRGSGLVPFDMTAIGQYGPGMTASCLKKRDYKDATDLVVIPINTQIAMRHEALGEGTGLGVGEGGDPAFTLQANHHHAVHSGMQVRRLTPRECERLQGFPDDYTLIPQYAKGSRKSDAEEVARWIMRGSPGMTLEEGLKWAGHPDGPRYKGLGNSMAVPVMGWLGARILKVDGMIRDNELRQGKA